MLKAMDMTVKEGVERDADSDSDSDDDGELTPLTKSVYAQPRDENGKYEGPISYVRRRYEKKELFNSPGGFHGLWKQVSAS